uniref:Putative VQ motif-containing protein n=1 Tax=Davidia involucrata TaxID=16924 RepID=A0A5B6ZXV3_DAVIN
MDSGNSGSLQSSSGGDEEYDSRAESISAFLNPTGHMGLMPNPPPPPPPPHHHHASTTPPIFYQLANNLDLMPRPQPPLSNPNSLLNLDMVWCKPQRSEPNCTEMNPILASSSAQQQPFFGVRALSSSPTVPFPPVTENPTASDPAVVGRNPKKRSRASRRAPTTVLTTDTTNFRAMVQEFTGIPAPPFTSSPFPRTRFDLFATPSTIRSNPLVVDPSQPPPPYLLRPFAQKVQPPPFLNSDHQLGLLKQPQSLVLNNQNQNQNSFTFQSLLQPHPKYPLPNLGSKSSQGSAQLEIPSNDHHSTLKMGVFDEFGLSHGHVTGLPSLVSPDGTASRNNSNPTSWVDGDGDQGQGQGHLRSVNGSYNLLRNGNFHAEKGSENIVPARGEDMVESWICSSD